MSAMRIISLQDQKEAETLPMINNDYFSRVSLIRFVELGKFELSKFVSLAYRSFDSGSAELVNSLENIAWAHESKDGIIKDKLIRENKARRIKRQRNSSGDKIENQQSFKEWFRLNVDESNLEELVVGYTKKTVRLTIDELNKYKKTGFENLSDIVNISGKILKYFDSCDPRTLQRVRQELEEKESTPEEIFERVKEAHPEMGAAFSINVNHKVPNIGEGIAQMFSGMKSTVGQCLFMAKEKVDSAILNANNDIQGSVLFAFFCMFIIVGGFATSQIVIKNKYVKLLILVIPLINMYGGLGEQVEVFFKALSAGLVAQLQKYSSARSTNDGVSTDLVPEIETTTLVDVAGLLYGALSIKLFGFKTPESVLKTISTFWHARPAIEDMVIKLSELVTSVVNGFITEYTDYKPFRILHMKGEKYEKIQERCDYFINAFNTSVLAVSQSEFKSIRTLEIEMKIEYCNMMKDRNLRGETLLFRKELQKIEEIRAWMQKKLGTNSMFRVEPTVICLSGPPGTGKSEITKFLAVDLSKMAATKEQLKVINETPGSYVYNRVPSPHWSEYKLETLVTIMDDFDQNVDLANSTNSSFLEFICMGSAAAYPLEMAHLDEKGVTLFLSHFLCLNTNTKEFNPQSIRSAEALNRRINFRLYVAPRPMYCTDETKSAHPEKRRLDRSKLPKYINSSGDGTSKMTPEMGDYFYLDDKGNFVDTFAHSYSAILDAVKKTYKMKCLWHESFMSEINNRTKRKDYDREAILNEKPYRDVSKAARISKMPVFEEEVFHDASPEMECSSGDSVGDVIERLEKLSNSSKFNEVKMEAMPGQYSTAYSSNDADSESDISDEEVFDKAKEIITSWNDNMKFEEDGEFSVEYRKLRCIQEIYTNSFQEYGFVPIDKCLARLIKVYGEQTVLDHIHFIVELGEDPGLPIQWKPTDIQYDSYEFSYDSMWTKMFKRAKTLLKKGTVWFHSLIQYIDSEIFKSIVGTLVLLASLYGGYKYFSQETPEELEPESFNIGEKLGKNQKTQKWVGKDFKSVLPKKATPQISHGSDPSGGQVITSVLKKNMFTIGYEEVPGSNKFKKGGNMIVLEGRMVLTHYHALTKWLSMVKSNPECLNCVIKYTAFDARGYEKRFMLVDILENLHEECQIPGKDLAIYEMPEAFQPRISCISRFALRSDFATFRKNIEYILVMNNDGYPQFHTGLAKAMDEEMRVTADWSESYMIRNGYEYEAPTAPGDCGSLFCAMNASVPVRKIFGIHVAKGNATKIAYAEAVCQEEINERLAIIGKIYVAPVIEDLPYASPEIGDMYDSPQFNVIARLAPAQIPSKTLETSIVRSRLFDKVAPHACLPAVLKTVERNGVLIDPMDKAKLKLAVRPTAVHKRMVVSIRNSLYAFLMDSSRVEVDKRLLSSHECLFGSDSESVLRKISASTSPGYPEVLLPKSDRFKTRLFKTEEGSDERKKAIEEYELHISPIEEKIRKGIRPVFLYVAKLKDEKRLIEKIVSVSTRMFQCGPMDLLFLEKRYFGAFVAWCTLNRINNSFTGGVNVYSEEWNVLFRKLTKFGKNLKNIGAGDFAKYDGSQITDYHYACLWIINKWYDGSEEETLARTTLFLEICNARVIFDEFIVELPHGLPSGNFLTFLINCMMNQLYHRGSWVLCGEKLSDFEKYFWGAFHGDDSIFAVHPSKAEVFNEKVLEKTMLIQGVEYTNELKSEGSSQLRSIYEVSYLKRKFVYCDMIQSIIAPMDLVAVLEPLNWTTKKRSLETTADVVDVTLRELALHGEEIFNKYQKKIILACEKKLKQCTFTRSIYSDWNYWMEVVCTEEGII